MPSNGDALALDIQEQRFPPGSELVVLGLGQHFGGKIDPRGEKNVTGDAIGGCPRREGSASARHDHEQIHIGMLCGVAPRFAAKEFDGLDVTRQRRVQLSLKLLDRALFLGRECWHTRRSIARVRAASSVTGASALSLSWNRRERVLQED